MSFANTWLYLFLRSRPGDTCKPLILSGLSSLQSRPPFSWWANTPGPRRRIKTSCLAVCVCFPALPQRTSCVNSSCEQLRCTRTGDRSRQGSERCFWASSSCAPDVHRGCSPDTTRTVPSPHGDTRRIHWHTGGTWRRDTRQLSELIPVSPWETNTHAAHTSCNSGTHPVYSLVHTALSLIGVWVF